MYEIFIYTHIRIEIYTHIMLYKTDGNLNQY